MGGISNHVLAASQRPIGLRCRADLQIQRRERGGRFYYVIKNPWTLSYCQLQSEEYWLLRQINGQRSLQQIKQGFESHFPGKRIDTRRLEGLVRNLYQIGLLTSCVSGQGHQLLRRKQTSEQAAGLFSAQRLLAMRFRGINPDRVLSFLARGLSGLYQWPALVTMLGFVMATVLFAMVHWSDIWTRLPQIQSLVEWHSVLGLMVAVALMKILHELAHGVTCKVFGGECNELGLMLLLFVPCLYCDVSDSWMIESRRKRIAIASAGVIAESIVATAAFWVWWFANPGVVQTVAIQICIVGSISTILVNGNPLMRYDGYFVLSDLWAFPNLWMESRRIFWNRIHQFYSTAPSSHTRPIWQPKSVWLVLLYALASMGYQVFATLFIMLVIFVFCSAQRIELIGMILLSILFTALVVQTTASARRRFARLGGIRKLRRGRVALSFIVFASLVVLLLCVPVPFSIHSPGLARSPDLTPITVVVKGRLVSSVLEGAAIEAGQPVAQLQAPELAWALESRRGDLLRQRARLEGLESRRSIDKSVAVQIQPVREAIEGLELEVAKMESEVASLTLRAACSGKVVFPIPLHSEPSGERIQPLLAQQNIGGLLKSGTVAAWIRNAEEIEVITFLTQHQVQWVREGQSATLKLKCRPSSTLLGKVVDIGTSELKQVPRELIASGAFPMRHTGDGLQETTQPVYAVRIRCDSNDIPVYENAIARTSIHVSWQPLSMRIVRWFNETFTVSIKGSRQQPL
jgi:putative peptide zinc metalloprotease protein